MKPVVAYALVKGETISTTEMGAWPTSEGYCVDVYLTRKTAQYYKRSDERIVRVKITEDRK